MSLQKHLAVKRFLVIVVIKVLFFLNAPQLKVIIKVYQVRQQRRHLISNVRLLFAAKVHCELRKLLPLLLNFASVDQSQSMPAFCVLVLLHEEHKIAYLDADVLSEDDLIKLIRKSVFGVDFEVAVLVKAVKSQGQSRV